MRCVKIPGDGSPRIRTVIMYREILISWERRVSALLVLLPMMGILEFEWERGIIPSLTVNKRQNSRKASIYGLCGCLFVCIDMCYIFAFVLVIFFVFEIIPRMAAFDMNSKSVLNPNELWRASVSFVRL